MSRLELPSESILDKQCWKVVPHLWRNLGWHVVPFLMMKLGDFWLSVDQVSDTSSLPRTSRLMRLFGVVLYWFILGLAVRGWILLRRRWPPAANVLLAYAIIFTVLHLPLVMSTRIRFPLLDPPMAALAGGGLVAIMDHLRRHLVANGAGTDMALAKR